MKIEISDEIAAQCQLDEKEALTLLAIALYKTKGVHGSLAGKLVGLSEFEFHNLLSARGETVNYSVESLANDIKSNNIYNNI